MTLQSLIEEVRTNMPLSENKMLYSEIWSFKKKFFFTVKYGKESKKTVVIYRRSRYVGDEQLLFVNILTRDKDG